MQTRIKVVTTNGVKRYTAQYREWFFWRTGSTHERITDAQEDIKNLRREYHVEYVKFP
jgi:hypothetical protein